MTTKETLTKYRRRRPSPTAYNIPSVIGYKKHDITRKINPAYTFGMKIPEFEKTTPGPLYIKPLQTRFGMVNVPSYIMRETKVIRGRVSTPGPFTYAPENCPPMNGTKQPSYTFGVRTLLPKPQTPGPNAYKIPSCIGPKVPNKQSSPAYSISGRPLNFSMTIKNTPITSRTSRWLYPAAYNIPSVMGYKKHDITRKRNPAYTFGMKAPEFEKPSPGPNYIKPSQTRFGRANVPSYIM
jgi:hypothetical protein